MKGYGCKASGRTERLKTAIGSMRSEMKLAENGQRKGLRKTGPEIGDCRIFREYSTIGSTKTGLDRAKIAFSRIKTGY